MPFSWTSAMAFALSSSYFALSVTAQAVDTFYTSGVPIAAAATTTTTAQGASSTPQVHIIKAGAGGFKFEPQQITNVAIGDVVSFEFYPPDHSVARAEFGSACVPYEYSHRDKKGFWSGTQYVDTMAEITTYNITINSTEPIFFYCAAPNSCKGELMVGAINPNSTQTLAAQIQSAKSATLQLAPGDAIPREGGASSTPTSTSGPPSQQNPTPPHKLSTTIIVGIIVGIVAFIGLCAALFFFIGRSKSLKEIVRKHDEGAQMKPVGVGVVGNSGYSELGVAMHQFPVPPQTPQSGYQNEGAWGSPAPAYSSPVVGHAGLHFSDQKGAQGGVVELPSPTLGRQEFVAELDGGYVGGQEKRR
ncbi:hypothetical protein FB567DRAFT_590684 [Paraphoma chrysanthemicola]|uniref:Extracellular serine-rich protein n=1 Tax=Paraphoma chrysanthemicola TaxID=798071 RepID=A0A8K0RCC8_9PLEO|nr:hypothetical protein FB567DRAFT_590684 [Paraphoma chrysanthemicola]